MSWLVPKISPSEPAMRPSVEMNATSAPTRNESSKKRGPWVECGRGFAFARRSEVAATRPSGSLTLGTVMLIGAGTAGGSSSTGTAARRDGISASATISGSVLTPSTRLRPWSLAR